MPRDWSPQRAQQRRRVLRISGALAVLLIFGTAVALLTGVPSRVLAAVGLGGNNQANMPVTAPVIVNGGITFPTPTTAPWHTSIPPAAPIPSSQTPVPGSSPTATAVPTDTTGSPPPGPLPTTCNGVNGSNTWALTPCPVVSGRAVTLTVSAPSHPGASTNIVLNFGNCDGCTILRTPSAATTLDARGREAVTVTVPAGAAHGTLPIGGFVNIQGGPTLSINALPVQ